MGLIMDVWFLWSRNTHLSLSLTCTRFSFPPHVHTAAALMFRSTDGHLLSPAGLHPPRAPPNPRLHSQTHISNQREKTNCASINQSYCWAICSCLSMRIWLKHRWGLQNSCNLSDITDGSGGGLATERKSSTPVFPPSSCECFSPFSSLVDPPSSPWDRVLTECQMGGMHNT